MSSCCRMNGSCALCRTTASTPMQFPTWSRNGQIAACGQPPLCTGVSPWQSAASVREGMCSNRRVAAACHKHATHAVLIIDRMMALGLNRFCWLRTRMSTLRKWTRQAAPKSTRREAHMLGLCAVDVRRELFTLRRVADDKSASGARDRSAEPTRLQSGRARLACSASASARPLAAAQPYPRWPSQGTHSILAPHTVPDPHRFSV